MVALCLSALTVSLLLALAQITRLDSAGQRKDHFLLSLVTIEEATAALSDMEAGNRGFLLTGDEAFRQPFYQGRDVFSSRYKSLLAATAGDSTQQDRLKSIKGKLTQWFKLYNPLIRKRHELLNDRAGISYKEQVVLLKCHAVFSDIRFLLNEIRASEEQKSYAGGQLQSSFFFA